MVIVMSVDLNKLPEKTYFAIEAETNNIVEVEHGFITWLRLLIGSLNCNILDIYARVLNYETFSPVKANADHSAFYERLANKVDHYCEKKGVETFLVDADLSQIVNVPNEKKVAYRASNLSALTVKKVIVQFSSCFTALQNCQKNTFNQGATPTGSDILIH